MRIGLATLVCLCSFAWPSACAPPTCYSRALGLSGEVTALLDRIHAHRRTNSCVTTKLRDFLYVVLNHPTESCRRLPRMVLLKRKIQNLYTIVTRVCYRDLVFFTDDCEAIDTGHVRPHYAEDRLQLLQEER
ncbi:cytokine-like protein 1 isoform X2 [Cyclopterus lumpus]|uniref:cytokine-like protein 1 isoform X2 n=1 Tax=Cyclopterus lumpus TaxID=8103 RepID=UPI001486FA97|nr:cytokine-like protein 1 isoform X2 [Cyclopterus lumpus]